MTTPSHIRKIALAAILFIATAAASTGLLAQSQPDDNIAGITYILAFPDTTANKLDSRFPNNKVKEGFSLFLYSAVGPNRVKIITGGGATNAVTLEAGKFLSYDVKTNSAVTVSNSTQYNTIRLEAEKPIIVYCFFAVKQSCEAWTPIPVERWGREYNVAATPGDVVKDVGIAGSSVIPFYAKPSPAEFLILSAYDNTKVVVTNYGRKFNGSPDYTFTLGENQAYQIQSWCDTNIAATTQVDIGGVRIESDKPIGLISGNSRSGAGGGYKGVSGNAWKNMMMEWIPPTEQQGREFVSMPTWDALHVGSGAKVTRDTEYIRAYGTSGTGSRDTTSGSYAGGAIRDTFSVVKDTLFHLPVVPPHAIHFTTDRPSMMMMHSTPVVRLDTSYKGPSNQPGQQSRSYSGTGPYMVEMVPREQWSSFAPFYAPVNLATMAHYINVVTDTLSAKKISLENGSIFPFTWTIPGTDLIWGTMPVTPGVTHTLTGADGAKFSGFVYGLNRGSEIIRFKASPLPAEYEEYNALSYGYPLAPSRRVLAKPDSLRIDTMMECATLHISIRALNSSPVGFSSIKLDPDSSTNAKLMPVDPSRLSDIIGKTQVKVDVVPVDPRKPARGKVLVTDRTGAVSIIPFFLPIQQALATDSSRVDFGVVPANTPRVITITYTNRLDYAFQVKLLAAGNNGFTVVNTNPPFPADLKPGDSLKATVMFNGPIPNHEYIDSVELLLGCATSWIPLRASTPGALGITGSDHGDDRQMLTGNVFEGVSPNPVSGRMEINYHLSASGQVNVSIYNAAGERVAVLVEGARSVGDQSVIWNASAQPGGIYFCRIESGQWNATRTFVVTR